MAFRGIRFLPDETRIPWMRYHVPALIFSLVLTVLSIGWTAVFGLNRGTDFLGGTSIEVGTQGPADIEALRSRLNDLPGIDSVQVLTYGAPDVVLVRFQSTAPEAAGDGAAPAVVGAVPSTASPAASASPAGSATGLIEDESIQRVRAALGGDVDIRRVEFVGPQVGRELIEAGAIAILISILGILVYIWIRFEWAFGVCAVASLLHDVVTTVGLFAITGLEFDLTSVAAILTVAGYSVNDTVVVLDRLREDMQKYRTKPMRQLIDDAINKILARTVLTGGTTLIALLCLFLFGGPVISGFTVAIVWGIIIGTFSSIFVSAPLLLYLPVRREAPGVIRTQSGTQT